MVNPTGYTALDMVGFTDKGAFAANVNYVKNDLVHYGGDIWRVLIDDTIGITPTEGANYTLFIGEPTNLVERIIAPLEENPATIAYATGRQIIYNDYLYEVIDDIAVGDVLIAYEDDPTNANIKLADPVETQVLALKSEIQTLTNTVNTNTANIAKCETLVVSVASFSSLPQTVSNSAIEDDMVVVNSVLGTPSAQTGDWTVTTANGSLTINGSISGSTTATLYLMKSR